MEATQNAKATNRGRRKILIVSALVISVGAYISFFWFQTLMIMQMRYSYRNIPIASMKPVELGDQSINENNGTKLSYFGYDFEVPWQDVDTDNIQSKTIALIPFRSGLGILVGHGSTHDLMDTVMSGMKTDLAHFRAAYGDEATHSDYEFLSLALNTTPNQVSLFDSKADVARKSTLVLYKAIMVPGDSGIFELQTPEFKGFQYGDPRKHPKKVTVYLASANGIIEFTFSQKDMKPLTTSQADINRVIQTTHEANSTASRISASLQK
jgi:hypothetical protein